MRTSSVTIPAIREIPQRRALRARPCGFSRAGAADTATAYVRLAGGARAAGSKPSSPAEVFARMRRSFDESAARGKSGRFLFRISGNDGGDWYIVVANGKLTMGTGSIPNPQVTLMASDEDWVKISNREIGGMRAFLTGKLRFEGDRDLARRLEDWF